MGVDLIKKNKVFPLGGESFKESFEISEAIKLSDNMANIETIELCSCDIALRESFTQGEKTFFRGGIFLNILYLTESGGLASIKEKIPFEAILDAKGVFNPNVRISSFNYEVVKKRRIEVSAKAEINAREIIKSEVELVDTKKSNLELELKTISTNYLDMDTIFTSQEYEFIKDITLGEEAQIVYANATLSDELSNKSAVGVLYSANVNVNILYSRPLEDEATEYKSILFSFPVNHFVEKKPSFRCDSYNIYPSIQNIDALYIQTDENNTLNIKVNLCATTILFQKEEAQIIADGYSINKGVDIVLNNYSVLNMLNEINENIMISGEIKPANNIVFGGLIAQTQAITYSSQIVDKKLIIDGFFIAQVATYAKGETPYYKCQSKIPFTFEMECAPNVKEVFLNLVINNASYESFPNKIMVNANILIKGYAIQDEEISLINDAIFNEKLDVKDEYMRIKVYYKEKDESLWEIAKENRKKISEILKDNGFENESDIEDGYPILIK